MEVAARAARPFFALFCVCRLEYQQISSGKPGIGEFRESSPGSAAAWSPLSRRRLPAT